MNDCTWWLLMHFFERCSATQFDPDVAATFSENIDGYREEQRSMGIKTPE